MASGSTTASTAAATIIVRRKEAERGGHRFSDCLSSDDFPLERTAIHWDECIAILIAFATRVRVARAVHTGPS